MKNHAFLALTGVLSLHASGEALISETDIFSPLPMVSTVSRFAQPINKAPASITLIDKELIIASGAQNWVDLFRLVPGMQAYSINGNRPGIDYHGLGAEFPRQIEVTVDGRSVYQPLFSTVEWSVLNVSIDDIDHIEVIRGSNAASQGSNAFKAAINIVTERPHLKEDTSIHITAGSQDTQKININHNGYAGAFDYQVNFGFEHNDGFPAVKNNPDPDDNGPLKDGRDLFTANVRAIYAPNIKDTFEINVGSSHNHSGWGDPDHPDEYVVAEWDTNFESLRWSRLTNGGDELALHLYHTNFQASNDIEFPISVILTALLETEVTPEAVPSVLDSLGIPAVMDQPLQIGFGDLEADRYDIELEHHLQVSNKIKLSWGAGYRYEELNALKLLDTSKTFENNSRRLFASSEWSVNRNFTLNLAGMLENNSIVDTISSSRISLNFHPTPEHGFRFSYAKGERTPSLLEANEQNLNRIGNTVWQLVRVSDNNLHEEKITSYELAYMANLNHSLSFDVKVFREEIRDAIYDQRNFTPEILPLLPEDYVLLMERSRINRNILDQTLDGVEVQLKYRPTSQSLLAFHYTYLDRDAIFLQATTKSSSIAPTNMGNRVVPHTASLLAQIKWSHRVATSLWIYHMDEVNWDDGNSVDEFTRVDAQIRYTFPRGNKGTSGAVSLVAQNLGTDYADFAQNNVFETRIFLKLELDLP